MIRRLRFAQETPYHTVLELVPTGGERVMPAEVVEAGTGRRLAGDFTALDGSPIVVGGKTGSGDNRFKRFGPGGRPISSHAVNRTATFLSYIDDRYFGIVAAFVDGHDAEAYRFTSALPLAIVKLLAPALQKNHSLGAQWNEWPSTARRGRTQALFDFEPGLFGRIAVGRVGRQIEQWVSRCFHSGEQRRRDFLRKPQADPEFLGQLF